MSNFYCRKTIFLPLQKWFIGIIILLSTSLISAQNESLIAQAAEAYTSSNFEQAITAYEQVLADGWEGFEIYYNLGNAYYKTDQIAAAILNYERASRINPTDEDLIHNLNMARNRTVDKIDMLTVPQFVSGYKAFINNISSDSWGTISILTFFLALGTILAFLLVSAKWMKQLALSLLFIFVLASSFSFLFGWQQKKWLNANNEAIIFQPSIQVQSTPDDNGQELFVLHQGTKVQIVESFKNWARIRIGDGKTGWINKEAMEEI